MVNLDTLRLINLANELASLYENGGIKPFSKIVPGETTRGLYFDDECPYENNLHNDSIKEYPLVADMCVDNIHHDIISTYSPIPKLGIKRISVNEYSTEDDEVYYDVVICLEDDNGDTEEIFIEKGYWQLPGGNLYD
jgi:hypothetical protein